MTNDEIAFYTFMGSIGVAATFVALTAALSHAFGPFVFSGAIAVTTFAAMGINFYLKKNFSNKSPPW